MDTGQSRNNSWLQDNFMIVLVGFFFLIIILASFFSYSLSGLKASVEQTKTTTINQPIVESVQKSDTDQAVNSGPQVEITSSDPKIKEIVNKVFRHIFLPSGDLEIQSVVKPDELRKVNPIFYEFAKVGDYVLIYKDRAILYDPVGDLVLDIVHNPAQSQTK